MGIESMADLLAPRSRESFFRQSYGESFACIRGGPAKTAGLPTLERFRELLHRGIPWRSRRPPEIYFDGCRVDPENLSLRFTTMDGWDALAPLQDCIAEVLRGGCTIVSYGMQDYVPELEGLCDLVADQLVAETEAHLVYSRGGVAGLAPHYDSTEVFVLHLGGEKRWRIWDQRAPNPIGGRGVAEPHEAGRGSQELTLRDGDLLYLPRGTFHDALALSDESLHVSLVARVPTCHDFLEFLIERSLAFEDVRAYFGSFAPAASESAEVAAGNTLRKLVDIGLTAELMQEFEQVCRTRARRRLQAPAPLVAAVR